MLDGLSTLLPFLEEVWRLRLQPGNWKALQQVSPMHPRKVKQKPRRFYRGAFLVKDFAVRNKTLTSTSTFFLNTFQH